MGQIMKPVRVCASVYLSIRLCALSWSHFLIDFHQNWHKRKIPKVKASSLGVNVEPPFPLFCPRNLDFRPKVLKIHANINNAISALNVRESPKFSRLLRNRWGKNEMVTSDFRSEIESWLFRACAMTNMQYSHHLSLSVAFLLITCNF